MTYQHWNNGEEQETQQYKPRLFLNQQSSPNFITMMDKKTESKNNKINPLYPILISSCDKMNWNLETEMEKNDCYSCFYYAFEKSKYLIEPLLYYPLLSHIFRGGRASQTITKEIHKRFCCLTMLINCTNCNFNFWIFKSYKPKDRLFETTFETLGKVMQIS